MLAPQSQGKHAVEPKNQGAQQKPVEIGVSWESPETIQEYKYTLVIPAYNEEKRISPFLKSILEEAPASTEIIVVCDGNDRTADIVRTFGNRVKLITFSQRQGKGGAIIEGFKLAKGEVVGFVDADGAIPAYEVFRLASIVDENNPCVIGSRWVRGSVVEYSEPFLNVIAGRVFHYMTFLILGLRCKDTQCGVKFFHKNLLKVLVKRVQVRSRMADVALLYHTRLLGVKISEVGIHWSHKDGTRLPILSVIPLMFATLVGLKLVHSSKARLRKALANRVSRGIRNW